MRAESGKNEKRITTADYSFLILLKDISKALHY
jgi:hypothetical protein